VWVCETLLGLRCRTRVSVARYDALTDSVPTVSVYVTETDCTSVRERGDIDAVSVSDEVNQFENEMVRVVVTDSSSVSVCE
jgi:hypothetical protein